MEPEHPIAPKARSLRVHGIFVKNATKVGIVATKAAFLLRNIFSRQRSSKESSSGPSKKLTKQQKEIKKLDKLVETSHELLAQATTVFPFTLFPDTVSIDRNKVNIQRRQFFMTGEVLSVAFEDISKVSSSVGPFFGSLSVAMAMKPDDEIVVKYLWRHDAIRLKRILQGYMIALKNEVDCNSLGKEELLDKLMELGKDLHG